MDKQPTRVVVWLRPHKAPEKQLWWDGSKFGNEQRRRVVVGREYAEDLLSFLREEITDAELGADEIDTVLYGDWFGSWTPIQPNAEPPIAEPQPKALPEPLPSPKREATKPKPRPKRTKPRPTEPHFYLWLWSPVGDDFRWWGRLGFGDIEDRIELGFVEGTLTLGRVREAHPNASMGLRHTTLPEKPRPIRPTTQEPPAKKPRFRALRIEVNADVIPMGLTPSGRADNQTETFAQKCGCGVWTTSHSGLCCACRCHVFEGIVETPEPMRVAGYPGGHAIRQRGYTAKPEPLRARKAWEHFEHLHPYRTLLRIWFIPSCWYETGQTRLGWWGSWGAEYDGPVTAAPESHVDIAHPSDF